MVFCGDEGGSGSGLGFGYENGSGLDSVETGMVETNVVRGRQLCS